MTHNTKEMILKSATKLLARNGASGTTMRTVAADSGVQASVIYHYFSTKDDLLRGVRQRLTKYLDDVFDNAKPVNGARELLAQRLELNIKHREEIVALLQYFMFAKQDFPLLSGGYVPPRAYRHMREIIDMGMEEGRYESEDPEFDAKILAHLVNGFLMEYYPHKITAYELKMLVVKLTDFIEKSLTRDCV